MNRFPECPLGPDVRFGMARFVVEGLSAATDAALDQSSGSVTTAQALTQGELARWRAVGATAEADFLAGHPDLAERVQKCAMMRRAGQCVVHALM